ncbi:hypothetical protein TALC_01255 [Thermoplasmatales archaeon BRNA1]|nr:hypothetical protein TALC_01255 [Thermoplasmatales archaeon BRNA1]
MCRECGAPIDGEYGFCVFCGAEYVFKEASGEPVSFAAESVSALTAEVARSNYLFTNFLLFAWVAASMVYGTLALIFPDTMIEVGKMAYSPAALRVMGVSLIGSGIFALLSGVCCTRRSNWKQAVYLCMAAAALPFVILILGDSTGLLLALVGFVVALRISKEKSVFNS